ncbi:MAG: lyase family protein [Conexivisphaerales archaeon]
MSYHEAISPLDDRYFEEAKEVSRYLSESALIRARVRVEIEYIKLLMSIGIAPKAKLPKFEISVEKVKEIEKKVRHDVKAVELYLREELLKAGVKRLMAFVHLGLTSEDVNSIAYGIMIKSFVDDILLPEYKKVDFALADLAYREAGSIMPARTHGKLAVPTTFGKEMSVFAMRIAERIGKLSKIRPLAKCSGAVGTYASFRLMKDADWMPLLRNFVRHFGLDFAPYTTQIAPYERLSDIMHYIININQVLISLTRDLWTYQMLGYVRIRSSPSEIGSSTMPQKENPADLENAEAQCEISTTMLSFLAYRLEVNRLQRDLSDSALRRTIGEAMAHSLIACKRIFSTLERVEVLRNRMKEEVEEHGELMAESVQVSLRLKGDEEGYEKVFHAFRIDDRKEIERLLKNHASRPEDYLGYSKELASGCRREVEKILKSKKGMNEKKAKKAMNGS